MMAKAALVVCVSTCHALAPFTTLFRRHMLPAIAVQHASRTQERDKIDEMRVLVATTGPTADVLDTHSTDVRVAEAKLAELESWVEEKEMNVRLARSCASQIKRSCMSSAMRR